MVMLAQMRGASADHDIVPSHGQLQWRRCHVVGGANDVELRFLQAGGARERLKRERLRTIPAATAHLHGVVALAAEPQAVRACGWARTALA